MNEAGSCQNLLHESERPDQTMPEAAMNEAGSCQNLLHEFKARPNHLDQWPHESKTTICR